MDRYDIARAIARVLNDGGERQGIDFADTAGSSVIVECGQQRFRLDITLEGTVGNP